MNKILKILFAVCLMAMPTLSFAEKRVALIIGNADYSGGMYDRLSTPVNDAREIEKKLNLLEFKTKVVLDGSKQDILNAIIEFNRMLEGSDVAVFFYSGHASIMNGEQYMIPCKDELHKDTLSEECVKISSVRSNMEKRSVLSLLFLDACRDVVSDEYGTKGMSAPFNIGTRRKDDQPRGCVTLYATGWGQTTITGTGNFSPFTQSVSKHLMDTVEFSYFWEKIEEEVYAATNRKPERVGNITGNFYFNPNGMYPLKKTEKSSAVSVESDKVSVRFYATPSNATIYILGKKYNVNSNITLYKGNNYSYTVEAPGYKKFSGTIIPDHTPSISIALEPEEIFDVYVGCNNKGKVNAAVYMDDEFKGNITESRTLKMKALKGSHKIRVESAKYYSDTKIVDVDKKTSVRFYLVRKYSDWADAFTGYGWDDLYHNTGYMFSPKYQIGFFYQYRFPQSRFSLGGIMGFSPGLFRGLNLGGVGLEISRNATITNLDESGNPTHKTQTTLYKAENDAYSELVDPYGEAEKHDANFLIMANVGYNICNGFMLECGVGAASHRDKYYMEKAYETYVIQDLDLDDNPIGDPSYSYTRLDRDQWYKGKMKWSPAIRLGGKICFPLSRTMDYGITVGAGYTYLPTNHPYSSWDVNLGFLWMF